ncbi:MAG: hypothetical protein ACYCT0_10245 [Sulfobacillus sp.]
MMMPAWLRRKFFTGWGWVATAWSLCVLGWTVGLLARVLGLSAQWVRSLWNVSLEGALVIVAGLALLQIGGLITDGIRWLWPRPRPISPKAAGERDSFRDSRGGLCLGGAFPSAGKFINAQSAQKG